MFKFFKRFYTFKNSINFVYSDTSRYYGSTVMRGEQLSKIAQKALYPSKVYFTSTDYNYKNCILFLPKWSIFAFTLKELRQLKERGNKLIFDPVDAIDYILTSKRLKYADIVIAISETIYQNYKDAFPPNIKFVLVNHNVDLRLKKLDWFKRSKTFRVGYFGEAISAIITPKIKRRVNFVWVDTIQQNNDWFNELPRYNLHYAIRQLRNAYPNKPFMKGFVAAHCGANILIQDSEKEAVRWLGKNYPYLLKGKVTEKKILEMLKYAEKTFGTKVWKRGLKVMEKIKKQTSEKVIGNQIINVFKYCEVNLKS